MRKLSLLLMLLCSCPAWATWTFTQAAVNSACAATQSCSVTVSSTGSGHLLVAAIIQGSSTATISAVTSAACSSTWTHVASSNGGASGDGFADFYYCANSASGQTSISITLQAGQNYAGCCAMIWEAASSAGSIAVDSGTTPAKAGPQNAGCTSCAGAALTLSGNNDFIATIATCGQTCGSTGFAGTNCTADNSFPTGDGTAHCMNVSANTNYPTTWGQSPSGTLYPFAVAFQESSGATAHTAIPGGIR